MVERLTITLSSPVHHSTLKCQDSSQPGYKNNPQTTLPYKPVGVNEVTLTLIVNIQYSTLSSASVPALAYKNLSHLHYIVTHYEVIEYFQETLMGPHMCSQALCYRYGMASAISASLMSTAHRAMGKRHHCCC